MAWRPNDSDGPIKPYWMINTSLLDDIMQHLGKAFVCIDRQWQYMFVNDKALQLFRKPKESLIGNTLWEVFPRNVGTVFDTTCHKAMEGMKVPAFEILYDSDTWLEVQVYPHRQGIAIFYDDITERKAQEEKSKAALAALESKLKDRTREVEHMNRELESFSYSVSHDLRAPLRAVQGYLGIFVEDYSKDIDSEAKRLIDVVIKNAVTMNQLIEDLLKLSRLGRKGFSKTLIDMEDLANEVWRDLHRREPERSIHFTMHALPEANADHATIKLVWENLFSNALKYTRHSQEASVEVGCKTIGNAQVYYIKDNGVGFDMLYYNKLFGVFQRLHSPEDYEGSGIGLAIAQKIISRHGGKIWAEAKPNQGAVFYFSLQHDH